MRGIVADSRPQSLEIPSGAGGLVGRAVELDPRNSEALARLSRAIVLKVTQGHASSDKQKLGRAASRCSTRRKKHSGIDPGQPSRAHYAMGLVHVLRGDSVRSAFANEAAIALDRNFALAHNNLGNSYVHLGKGKEALVAAEIALQLDPRGPQLAASWTVAGFGRLLVEDIDEALMCFSRARTANPDFPAPTSELRSLWR